MGTIFCVASERDMLGIMRLLRGVMWGVLIWGMVSSPSWAASPSAVLKPVQSIVLAASSIQFKAFAYLARGDIAGAIVLYETETGHPAPAWLTELQAAYGIANQAVGRCQQVARSIHAAFSQLEKTPQYIAFKTKGDEAFMVFEFESGKQASVSLNGYHVAVKLGDMIYDAYTGPLGMKMADYLSRLHAIQGVTSEVVTAP